MRAWVGIWVVSLLVVLGWNSVALAGRVVKVGVYQNHPQVFTDSHGRVQGFDIDLLEFVAAQEGWTLKLVPGTWTQGLERVKQGEIDLLTAVPYSEESRRTLDFTQETILANWGQLYVADARIQSLLDLEEKIIVGMENDIYAQQFKIMLNQFGIHYQFLLVKEYGQALEFLMAGKADAAIVAKTFGLMNDQHYQVLRSAIVCCPVEMRFAVPKRTNVDLSDAIDRHLHALKKDNGSFYFLSMSRWFGMLDREIMPFWMVWLLLGGGVVFLGVLTWLILLLRKLRRRTQALQQERDVRQERDGQLERTYRELAANAQELRDAKDIAEGANRAKSQFLTNMGHEIRTPMNAILGMTEMALHTDIPPKTRELLGHVLTASRSLLRIINSILEFTKLDRGQEVLLVEPFDLMDDVFAHIMEFATSPAVAKGIDLNFSLDMGTPRSLLGDREKLEKILIYLIDNALKFTNKGKVTIRASLRERHGERVRLEFLIQDTGVGVEPEQLLRIFDPFVQGDATLTRRHGGAGMGLAVCKRLVELMRGRLWVESVVGQGSLFYFTIWLKIRDDGQEESTSKPLQLTSASIVGEESNDSSHGDAKDQALPRSVDSTNDWVVLGQAHQGLLQRLADHLEYGDSLGAEQVLSELKTIFDGSVVCKELHRIGGLLDEFELHAARQMLGHFVKSLDVTLIRRGQ